MTRKVRIALLLCLAVVLLAPAAAQAAGTLNASMSGTEVRIRFTGAAGKANDVTITTEPGKVVVTDAADTIDIMIGSVPGCAGGGTNTITCTQPNIVDVDADLEDQADRLRGSGTVSIFVNGGAGNDDITSTPFVPGNREVRTGVVGEEGDDTIVTGDAADNAEGGPGADNISTGAGDDSGSGDEGDNDRINLGSGDDNSSVDAGDGVGDVHDGGPGLDALSMGVAFPPPPLDFDILVDLATGTVGGNNVGAGTVIGYEDVDLFRHRSTNVKGTAGQNIITTRDGADTIDPGAGSDFIDMSAGNDQALVRDGFQDLVRCGDGTDTAQVDQLDITTDCETIDLATVTPAGVPTTRPNCRFGRFKAKVARTAVLKRGFPGRVTCAIATTLEVRLVGQAKRRGSGIRAARAGDIVFAERSVRLGAGTRSFRLKVPRKLRAAIPRTARLRLVVVARDEFGNARRLTKPVRLTARKRR
jgi:Ca2+-binding RTX toxin-like protein